MSTIFTKIVAGEIPCHEVWADDRHFAFLDINPRAPGHTLVIPKREVSYIFDLEPEEYDGLWRAARTVADRMKTALSCERICVSVIGWEVPHVHVHLVPTNRIEDFPFPPPQTTTAAELSAMAARLRGED